MADIVVLISVGLICFLFGIAVGISEGDIWRKS